MRPVDRMGLNADGIHRWLYRQSHNSQFAFDPNHAAIAYGTTRALFMVCLDVLLASGDVVYTNPGTNDLSLVIEITRPPDYDPSDDRLGQGIRPATWIVSRAHATQIRNEQENAAAVEFFQRYIKEAFE